MKKLLLGFILLLSTASLCFGQQGFPENYFYDLQGIEDSDGTTHLFYRFYDEKTSTCAAYDPETDEYYQVEIIDRYRNIFHFNTHTGSDSLQVRNFSGQDNFCEFIGVTTVDIEFFEAHPDSFITYSIYSGFEANPAITDFKDMNIYLGLNASLPKVTYSPENDHVIFGYSFLTDNYHSSVSIPRNSEIWHQPYFDTSKVPDSLVLPYLVLDFDIYSSSYIAQNEDSLFIYNNTEANLLSTSFPIDFEHSWNFYSFEDTTLIYAANRMNIYHFFNNRSLLNITRDPQISADTLRSGTYFEYTFDMFSPNEIIISDSLKLLVSSNFGDSFELFGSFDSDITGLYKKPGSELLYVLTKEELLEIDMSTRESISLKQLPVSTEPEADVLPRKIILHQNYPNPFNPAAVIRYQLPESGVVSLEVFDVMGRRVALLVNGEMKMAGTYQVSFDASNLSSGIYLYRLQTAGQTITRKMTVVK